MSFSWTWIVIPLIALLVIWGGYSSYYTVQPEERAVVKRFGAVLTQTEPGLHFKLPYGIDTVQLVPTERVLKQEFGFRTRNVPESGKRWGKIAHLGQMRARIFVTKNRF